MSYFPAGGSLAGTYPNPTIAATGVTPGTYGSATQAPVLTLNAAGQITAASNVTTTDAVVMDNTAAAPKYATAPQTEGVWYGTGTKAVSGAATCVTIGNNSTTTGSTNNTAVGSLASATTAGSNVAVGASATASNFSTALGANCAATGTVSVAIGNTSTANILGAIAIGSNASAISNNGQIAIGYQTVASGQAAQIAIGYQASATGNYGDGIALGHSATVVAGNLAGTGIAIGFSSSVNGGNSIAIGRSALQNNVAVNDVTVIGHSATSTASQASAFGATATANTTSSVSLGYGSTIVDASHAIGFGVNASSVAPGSLGISVNSAAYQLALYTSLYATTATTTGTTTLTVTSARTQFFTGASTQTVKLPVATTLSNGFNFTIFNDSTGAVTVVTSGSNTLTILLGAVAGVTQGGGAVITCINTAGGTGVASWSYRQFASTV